MVFTPVLKSPVKTHTHPKKSDKKLCNPHKFGKSTNFFPNFGNTIFFSKKHKIHNEY